jgi:hypothetical protein
VIGTEVKSIKVSSMFQRSIFFDRDHIAADLKIPMLILGINNQQRNSLITLHVANLQPASLTVDSEDFVQIVKPDNTCLRSTIWQQSHQHRRKRCLGKILMGSGNHKPTLLQHPFEQILLHSGLAASALFGIASPQFSSSEGVF